MTEVVLYNGKSENPFTEDIQSLYDYFCGFWGDYK